MMPIEVQHTQDNGDRHYVYPPTGAEFPSVTTILSKGLPNEFTNVVLRETVISLREQPDQDDKWHKNAHHRFLKDRALLGTQVHEYAEMVGLGKPGPDYGADEHPEYADRCQAVDRFFAEVCPKVQRVETVCYHPELGYAGTFDIDAILPGLGLVRGDFKTSAGVYEKHRLQACAYARATHYLDDDGEVWALPEPDHAAVILFGKGGEYSIVPVQSDAATFETFKAAMEVAKWRGTKRPELQWSPPARLATPLEVIETRCKLLQLHGRLDEIGAAWPFGVPTFRQARESGQALDARQMGQISTAVDGVEHAAPVLGVNADLAERLTSLPSDLHASVSATIDTPALTDPAFTGAHHVLVDHYLTIAQATHAERCSVLAASMATARAAGYVPDDETVVGWVTDSGDGIGRLTGTDNELVCSALDAVADSYLTVVRDALVVSVDNPDSVIASLGGKGAVLNAGRAFAKQRGIASPRSSSDALQHPLMLVAALAKSVA